MKTINVNQYQKKASKPPQKKKEVMRLDLTYFEKDMETIFKFSPLSKIKQEKVCLIRHNYICKVSESHNYFAKYLKKKRVNYIHHFTFVNNDKVCVYDFFLPEYKTIIEIGNFDSGHYMDQTKSNISNFNGSMFRVIHIDRSFICNEDVMESKFNEIQLFNEDYDSSKADKVKIGLSTDKIKRREAYNSQMDVVSDRDKGKRSKIIKDLSSYDKVYFEEHNNALIQGLEYLRDSIIGLRKFCLQRTTTSEKILGEYFIKHNVPFIHIGAFMLNGNMIKFDFVLPEHSIVIDIANHNTKSDLYQNILSKKKILEDINIRHIAVQKETITNESQLNFIFKKYGVL